MSLQKSGEGIQKPIPILGVALLILAVHLTVFANGGRALYIDYYWQFISKKYLMTDFVGSLYYFHANPPMLSVLHYLVEKISLGNKYLWFQIILPIFHVFCFVIFCKILKKNEIKHATLISSILFLNPYIFLYFLYPFYSTLLFITSIIILYLLCSQRSIQFKLIALTLILSFNATLRSSYHIFIVWLLLLPFWIKVIKASNLKYVFLSLLITIVPLSIFLKNYVLFDRFTSSTWVGMNMNMHIPTEAENRTISKIHRFSRLDHYSQYIDEEMNW